MNSLEISKLISRRGTPGHDIALGLTALVLCIVVFYIDTFTSIESAVAVLYVLVILLAAEILSREGIRLLAICCGGLTVLSYFWTHGSDADLPAVLRLAVSLSALLITAALILRNEASRSALMASNTALRDSETRYRAIFEGSRVALWERDYSAARNYLLSLKAQGVTDLKEEVKRDPSIIPRCSSLMRTVAANRAALELIGHVADGQLSARGKLFASPNDEIFINLMDAIFREETQFEDNGMLTMDSGETKLVLACIRFPDDAAAYDRVVVGMLDITQREMAQKALLEAQAALARASRTTTMGVLSASLAHDLNQPLGALLMNAQTCLRWLKREPPDLERVQRSVERMVRDSQRASEIVSNTRRALMDSAQPLEVVDLEALLNETRALMERDLQRHAITLDIEADPKIPVVRAVRIEIQQVLVNLMNNAIQAMSEASSPTRRLIVTSSATPNRQICIAVRDFGPGIDDEHMAKLFEPFFTTKKSGMGLGLAICRGTLESRGGQLLARNHPEGGAVFEMILPTEEEDARQGTASATLS